MNLRRIWSGLALALAPRIDFLDLVERNPNIPDGRTDEIKTGAATAGAGGSEYTSARTASTRELP